MKKVMQLIQHPMIGGLEKMAFSLCHYESNDVEMHLVCLEGNTDSAINDWPELANLKYFHCLNKGPGFKFSIVKQLKRYIDKHQIDIVHSHHIGPLIYASLTCLNNRTLKHIHTLHDAWYLTQYKSQLLTCVFCKFTKVTLVADARSVAELASEYAHLKTDHIVLNGIDTNYFSPMSRYASRNLLHLPNNKTIIGCAARVESGKGHRELIRTLLKLPYTVHIAFAGKGKQLSAYQEYANELGVSERVHWLGSVDNMPAFYSAIDVFCLFSKREGLPLSILEAMSCNRPVVATDVGGVKEVLSKKCGCLLDANNETALPQALVEASKMNYGTDIRCYAKDVGNIKVMARRYLSIYQTEFA